MEELPPSDWSVTMSVVHLLMMIVGRCRRFYPEQGCVRKQAEQATETKPVSSGPLWSLPRFLRPDSSFEVLP